MLVSPLALSAHGGTQDSGFMHPGQRHVTSFTGLVQKRMHLPSSFPALDPDQHIRQVLLKHMCLGMHNGAVDFPIVAGWSKVIARSPQNDFKVTMGPGCTDDVETSPISFLGSAIVPGF